MAAAGCAIFRLARGCNCRIDRRRIAITRPNIRIVRQTLILHAYTHTHTQRYACIWNVRNKMRGWVGSKLDSGARRMISVCNDRAYRIARFPHHGRPMPILTTRRPTGIPPSGSFAPRDVFPDKGSAFAGASTCATRRRRTDARFPRRIVTAPALLTIDLVMALSRDSLMRPLTKLRRTGYRFAINYEFSWRARARARHLRCARRGRKERSRHRALYAKWSVPRATPYETG